jgi:DNA gyrase subunit A
MIINKSGITIRLKVADIRVMGRATQGVRLINLEKRNDEIASVCKVLSELEEEIAETEIENPETIVADADLDVVTDNELEETAQE